MYAVYLQGCGTGNVGYDMVKTHAKPYAVIGRMFLSRSILKYWPNI